jgi:hypothetical protein
VELKDFIKEALIEICDGIAEARSDIEAKYNGNCIIAPASVEGKPVMEKLSSITFDVAIHCEEEKNKNGKCVANLMVLSIDGELADKTTDKKISRVSFSLPFIPQGLRKEGKITNT